MKSSNLYGICCARSLSNCSVQLETAFLLSCAFAPLSQQASQLLLLGCYFIHVPPLVCKIRAADVAICKNEGFIIRQNGFQHPRRYGSRLTSHLPFFPGHRRLEKLEYKFYIEMRIDCLAILENLQGDQAPLWVHICVNHSEEAVGERKGQIWDRLKSHCEAQGDSSICKRNLLGTKPLHRHVKEIKRHLRVVLVPCEEAIDPEAISWRQGTTGGNAQHVDGQQMKIT